MVKHAAFMRRKEKKVEAPPPSAPAAPAPTAPAPAPAAPAPPPPKPKPKASWGAPSPAPTASKPKASWAAPSPKPTASPGAAAPRKASWGAALDGANKPKLSWSQLGGAAKTKAKDIRIGDAPPPKASWGSALGKERTNSEESPRSVVSSPVQAKEATSTKRGWGDATGNPVKRQRTEDPESCVVLACKYDTPNKNKDCPDHVRLDALQKLYPSFRVVGCSEYRPGPKSLDSKSGKADDVIMGQAHAKEDTHISANFKKTLREILRGRNPKVLMLDYFWLQPGYYEERYGMNFLSSKVDSDVGSKIRELFISHQCQVMLLPCDSRGAVREMYKNSFDDRPDCVCIDFVDERDGLKHHPLVRATRHIDSELKDLAKRVQHSKGRWHDMQMLRLQNPEPFLVAYRKGLDWRAYLDERCILGVAAEPSPLEIRPPPPPTTTKKRRSRSTTPPVVVSAPADVSSDDEPVGLIIARQGGDVSSDDEPVGLLVPASA